MVLIFWCTGAGPAWLLHRAQLCHTGWWLAVVGKVRLGLQLQLLGSLHQLGMVQLGCLCCTSVQLSLLHVCSARPSSACFFTVVGFTSAWLSALHFCSAWLSVGVVPGCCLINIGAKQFVIGLDTYLATSHCIVLGCLVLWVLLE